MDSKEKNMKDDRNRIITVLIILTLAFLALTLYVSSAYTPSVSARAAVLYEPSAKSFLYTKNENTLTLTHVYVGFCIIYVYFSAVIIKR